MTHENIYYLLHLVYTCEYVFIYHAYAYRKSLLLTSAGLGRNPGWETPSSPGFPTGTANLGLKARPLVPGLLTEIEWGPFSPGCLY